MTARSRIVALAGLATAGALALAAHRLRRGFFAVTVTGHSMTPALAPGDRILMRRGAARLRVGDVVVVVAPDPVCGWLPGAPLDPDLSRAGRFVKRVAALPGDTRPPFRREPVPAGHAFLLGDHPSSVDSKQYGCCPLDQVYGVAVRPLGGRGGPAV